ncbi:MAG: class I SAM-dependent methyltransferase, partial [Ferruginibacter sp.]|nr:class I SAM-dependent methyltransferase [Ferruginibacter sp.]
MIKKIFKKIIGIETYVDNTNDFEVIRNRNSEIKRYHIINYLISKYDLKSYLEIGVLKGDNIRKIIAPKKDGVDPGSERHVAPEVNYRMTSDDFFKIINKQPEVKYDIVFIDGLHHADQVRKDIYNSLLHLSPGGFIILHDCNPVSYDSQLVPRKTIVWNGDPWKAYVEFKGQHPELNCCVI